MKDYTLRDQLQAFYDDKDDPFLDNINYYWYDWFCKDKALRNKALKLLPKVRKFAELMGIDLDTHYVWFKNNCPLYGKLYDDFRIADIASGDNRWVVAPALGYDSRPGQAEVYNSEIGFEKPLYSAKSWTELINLIKESKK